MNEYAKLFWHEYLQTLGDGEKPSAPKILVAHAGTPAITDGLISLYLAGKKSAGSSLVADFQSCGETLPEVGNYWIMLDQEDRPKCIAKTIRVETNKFKDVPERIAIAEGEGDLSLEYWKRVHRQFFTPFLASWGISDLDEALVVTEHFQLVFPAPST